MQLDAQSIISAVGEVLAEERNHRMALQARIDELARPSFDPNAMLPAEISAEVAGAVRMLHEAPQFAQGVPPRVARIERDTDGNLVPIYGLAVAMPNEPQP